MCKTVDRDTPVLEIYNATYTYSGEEFPVWKQLSCQFYKGKIHVVAGPSGCGKSSVLYLLNGIIPHMEEGNLEGSILLDKKDITNEMPRYRCEKIGLVMQNPDSQFCTFTVEEELAFGMESLGLIKEEMQSRISKVLAYVGMSGYESRDLNRLSGGQKQRIAIASILVMEPEILLLDEPTANLDPQSRQEIFELIARLSREQGKTIILVEHNLERLLDIVDYALILDQEGRALGSGKKEAVKILLQGLTDQYNSKLSNYGGNIGAGKSTHDGTAKQIEKQSILELEHVSFSYPVQSENGVKENKKILDDFSLSIKAGDFLAILGENGAGKSTLLNLIFQIYVSYIGRITLYGKEIGRYRKKELYQLMGLVFQNPENQFVTNCVMDEMMFSLKKLKITPEEKNARVMNMLNRFHLECDLNKSPFILSQGQKRRLSVATMLLTNQEILFLDEPTYGQDYENRRELMDDMVELNKKGVTIVMITHDMSLVSKYAQRVVKIKAGKVAFDSSATAYFEEVFAKGGW